MHKPIPVVAYERYESIVFQSIADAADAYGLNKKIVCDRIKDGKTLGDGYTTLDWYSPPSHTEMMFDEYGTIGDEACKKVRRKSKRSPR